VSDIEILLTIIEAAAILRVKPSFFYECTRKGGTPEGRPPMIRVGRYLRIRKSDLEAFINDRPLITG